MGKEGIQRQQNPRIFASPFDVRRVPLKTPTGLPTCRTTDITHGYLRLKRSRGRDISIDVSKKGNPRTFTHSTDVPDLTRDNVRALVAKHGHSLVQRDPPKIPAALRVTPRARVVYQNPAHQLRCNTEEVRAILPADVSEIHQAFVGFVN
jgi:hypothetical protein